MKILVLIFFYSCNFFLVKGHGRLLKPLSRSEFCTNPSNSTDIRLCGDRDWLYCSFVTNQYYYRGGKCDVCGYNGYPKTSWWNAYDTSATGQIRATYTSGEKINVTVIIGNHNGYMRVKLCKLQNKTDRVSLDCLNKNSLKLELIEQSHLNETFKNTKIDDYTIFTKYVAYGYQFESVVSVYLPVGLDCENCVLQWEWHTTDQVQYCKSKSGVTINNAWNVDYNDSPCLTQIFRTCSDITINPIQNQPVLIETPYIIKNKEPIFSCILHRNDRGNEYGNGIKSIEHINSVDNYKDVGTGMVCAMSEEHFISTNSDNNYLRNTFCPSCYDNCFLPGKTCPTSCYCRWFKKYPEAQRLKV